ncbi:MAG: amino acid synthesis family protein [Desulfobacteraceae bacterium]|nr:amino acid synthesis family protein [Desulfobacteraceae bacterium]
MKIRKIVTMVEETFVEGFKEVEGPIRMAASMAVISNPYAGKYQEDLTPLIQEYSTYLAKELVPRARKALDADVEGYGKGALVGLDGEIEHGSALIHTVEWGKPFRDAIGGGKSLLPSSEKRGSAGSPIDVPIKHWIDDHTRSHHQTLEVRIPDAPRSDEIVIVAALANSGRAHPRIGDLKAEMKEKGVDDFMG